MVAVYRFLFHDLVRSTSYKSLLSVQHGTQLARAPDQIPILIFVADLIGS